MKINLDEIIDPMEGRVVVTHDANGHPQARFDLQGLPRVDGMLIGKTALEALNMTEHLCGICPVAHHLAGTRALDILTASPIISAPAEMTRRLLHYGSIVEAHSLRFLMQDRDAGIMLKKLSKQMLVAAGSPGHFPVTAAPGGVAAWPNREALQNVAAVLPAALDTLQALCARALETPDDSNLPTDFTGADVALIDLDGNPDVFGTRVRVSQQGETLDEFGFEAWNERITEAIPGSPAPRPYLTALGPEAGRYRVGPVAQLSIGTLTTDRAASLQAHWLEHNRHAATARAIVTLHVLERTEELTTGLLKLKEEEMGEPVYPATLHFHAGTATGLVDGPRGILAHTVTLDDSAAITAATILTPTAQNEPWLAMLLTQATAADAPTQAAALEDSIREADPCLPISSAPEGMMGLKVDNL